MKFFSLFLVSLILSLNSFAIALITGGTHICATSISDLSDATSGGTWGSSNAAIATVNATGVVSGISAGTSVITYTAGGSYALTTVTVTPSPAIYLVTGGGSYCAGDSGVLVGLSGSQLGVDYSLVHGASGTGPVAGTTATLNFGLQTAAGTYIVVATITATGCSSYMSGSAVVTITASVPVSVSIAARPGDTVCSGTPTLFTALPFGEGASPEYQWAVNGVHVGGDTSAYSFIPNNGDVVQVTMVSSAACAVPDTVAAFDTMAVITRVVPAVGISAVPGTDVCRGTAVVLTAVPAYGGPAPFYSWTKNGVRVSTGGAYTFTPVNHDTINVTMVSDFACLLRDTVISPKITMVVDSPVTPILAITANPGTHILPGQMDTLTAVVTDGGTSPTFVWWLNGVETSDTTDQYISNTFSAPYPDSVTCIVTSSTGCMYSTFSWVYIVVSDVGVTGSPLAEESIKVFPNPNNGVFTVQGLLGSMPDEEVSLILADVLGRVVYKVTTIVNNGQVNIRMSLSGSLDDGMYILNLSSDSENRTFPILIRN